MGLKISVDKSAAKKATAKSATSKGTPRRSAPRKTASMSRAKVVVVPPGHKRVSSGLVVPERTLLKPPDSVVPASKLEKGIASARARISGVLEELVEATRDSYEITEIELAASFNADGKFLGFGVGGAMSVTFRVRPVAP